jgi:hypothetical protein
MKIMSVKLYPKVKQKQNNIKAKIKYNLSKLLPNNDRRNRHKDTQTDGRDL